MAVLGQLVQLRIERKQATGERYEKRRESLLHSDTLSQAFSQVFSASPKHHTVRFIDSVQRSLLSITLFSSHSLIWPYFFFIREINQSIRLFQFSREESLRIVK